jgi:hypothetical protein
MTVLTGEWQIIKSVEGGEILAADDAGRIRVSFPEDISEGAVRDALFDKGIEVGDSVVFEAGEAEGETVAFFSKP